MDKTYKRHSFTKLWIATAMFIFCCFATSAFAQEAVDAATEKIMNGELHPFAGPIYDQDGNEKVPEGTTMTDDEIWNMSWFVKGVIGSAQG